MPRFETLIGAGADDGTGSAEGTLADAEGPVYDVICDFAVGLAVEKVNGLVKPGVSWGVGITERDSNCAAYED